MKPSEHGASLLQCERTSEATAPIEKRKRARDCFRSVRANHPCDGEIINRGFNPAFSCRVQIACGFIEDENIRLAVKGPSKKMRWRCPSDIVAPVSLTRVSKPMG